MNASNISYKLNSISIAVIRKDFYFLMIVHNSEITYSSNKVQIVQIKNVRLIKRIKILLRY